jgi:Pyruvate/2-oxoacid:ferredoxin oxidoreductase gamma subunit
MDQYERDRGRLVRRRYQFDTEKSETTQILSLNKSADMLAPISGVGGFGTSKTGVWSLKTTTTIDRWFSGAFVYGSPIRDTYVSESLDLAEKADRLLGLSLTPDVLWNLTPWSWATDWALNTGDILAYASDVASQGLVMRYGYIMEHSIREYEYQLTGAVRRGRDLGTLNAVLTTEVKQRRGANPFGFGLTWDGLTTAQASILAALGISRK